MSTPTATEAEDAQRSDLGFSYRIRKNGNMDISHRSRIAATLRVDAADAFRRQVETGGEAAAQQLMARITGNYKRGNERKASRHPRNRGR